MSCWIIIAALLNKILSTGADFESAYKIAFQAITPNGMHEIQEELYFMLNHKQQTIMKTYHLFLRVFNRILYLHRYYVQNHALAGRFHPIPHRFPFSDRHGHYPVLQFSKTLESAHSGI